MSNEWHTGYLVTGAVVGALGAVGTVVGTRVTSAFPRYTDEQRAEFDRGARVQAALWVAGGVVVGLAAAWTGWRLLVVALLVYLVVNLLGFGLMYWIRSLNPNGPPSEAAASAELAEDEEPQGDDREHDENGPEHGSASL